MSLTSVSRFVVDAADSEKFDAAKNELRELLAKPPLAGIPLLVLGVRIHTRRMHWLTRYEQNKNDLKEAANVDQLIEKLCVPALQHLHSHFPSVNSVPSRTERCVATLSPRAIRSTSTSPWSGSASTRRQPSETALSVIIPFVVLIRPASAV